MAKLTARLGELRIYDSSDIAARGSASNMDLQVFDASGDSYTDKTSEGYASGANQVGTVLVEEDDAVFLGCIARFARIKFVKGASGAYAVGAGAIAVTYWDGSNWTALTVVDGTAVGGHTLKADGVIYFSIPADWTEGGNASLDANKFYVRIKCAAVPGTPPNPDQLAPVDGQFYSIPFVKMDFNGPLGRPKTDEILVMNRGRMDAFAHYMEGGDDKRYAPLAATFSADIDDTHNNTVLFDALACGTPGSTYWTEAGVTSKGTTKNDGTNFNPAFVDANKKTVIVQALWSGANGKIGFAYYETYFPQDELKLAESDEGLALSAAGAVFGVIERISEFGVKF